MNDNAPNDPNFPIEASRDTLNVSRSFGQAYEVDGATIIPVAKVMGGSGTGYGTGSGGAKADESAGPHAEGSGGGGGYGTRVKPLGAYVVRDGQMSWQPAIDINRAILGGQVVGIALIVAYACLRRARHKARRWDYLAARAGKRARKG